MLEHITVGAVVFASTNVDDILLLSAFFAQPGRSVAGIVFGQYLGIGVLVLVSVVAALAALAIPPDWVAFIGVVPIARTQIPLRAAGHWNDGAGAGRRWIADGGSRDHRQRRR
jgi:cadmium resistance protein CadD (predicted permease)